jgi:hypothetical protein
MLITRISQLTGIEHTLDINVTEEQMNDYNSGTLLQIAFPDLDKGLREFIKTGITPEEWDDEFGDMKDEISHEDDDDDYKINDTPDNREFDRTEPWRTIDLNDGPGDSQK